MQNPILVLAEGIRNNQPCELATIVTISGASPAKTGAQIVLLSDGSTAGTVGGGKLEAAILEDAQEALMNEKPVLKHYALREEGEDAVGTMCGGEIQVFLLPYQPPPKLVIVGGGHIGRSLKIIGEAAGFDVIVMDIEAGRATVPELETVPLIEDSFVVLITTDHVSDEAALRYALTTPACYIGMIGSRTKCRTILNHLKADGITDDSLKRVYAPIGLNLGGPSPEEIAVAILAEVIAVRRGGTGGIRSRE
jgi:xanthine dehydrogenase accessory factor